MERTGVAPYEQLGASCNRNKLLQRRWQWVGATRPRGCCNLMSQLFLAGSERNDRPDTVFAVQPVRYMTETSGLPQLRAPPSARIDYREGMIPITHGPICKLFILGAH